MENSKMRKWKIRGFPSRRSVSTMSKRQHVSLGSQKKKKENNKVVNKGSKSNNKHMVFVRR